MQGSKRHHHRRRRRHSTTTKKLSPKNAHSILSITSFDLWLAWRHHHQHRQKHSSFVRQLPQRPLPEARHHPPLTAVSCHPSVSSSSSSSSSSSPSPHTSP